MKIVIVGDGKVGFTLSQQLAKEGHDIVIIDNNETVLNNSSNTLDVNCIKGNGANYKIQEKAGVQEADLMIAVTSRDELNIICCLIAKKLGAKHTIARVRNPEYSDEMSFIKDELGLSMAVNPEAAAAAEIARILQFPSAIKIDSFSRGKVELAEFKVMPNSPLDGMAIHTLYYKYKIRILICAVQRKGAVFIPNGDFRLQEGDKVTITASPKNMTDFFRQIGILMHKIKTVMIVGGGKIAYYLCNQICNLGMKVKIIEIDPEQCSQLTDVLPKAMIINADGSDQEVLNEEGIEGVDAFIALTNMDEENVIISMYAISRGVDKVITKINHLTFMEIMENAGIDCIISPKYITANHIIRYVRAMQNSWGSNVETMTKIVDNQVEALEFRVRESFRGLNVPLKDIELKRNVLVACINRKGQIIIPSGQDKIQLGDSVIVVTTINGLRELNDIFRM